MKPISMTRIVIIALVTFFSIWFTVPTAMYYLHLRHQPKITGQRVFPKSAEPPKERVAEHAAWEAQNTEYVAWANQNMEFVAWDKKEAELRNDRRLFLSSAAIPLGLDLIGGVDVTLAIDRDQQVTNEVASVIASIQRDLTAEKLNATVNPSRDGKAMVVTVTNKADARRAANIINQYEQRIADTVTEAQLQAGPVTIALSEAYLNRSVLDSIDGARKGISDRVDRLGVTQPRIARQGEDRIRVQVPGEKDPNRLIDTVIKPAHLEFRLVSKDNDRVIGADGKAVPGEKVPLGTELVTEKQGNVNKTTNQMEYKDGQILLLKNVELTGKELRSAGVTYNPSDFENPIQVSLEFNEEGTKRFGEVTGKNVGRRLAILLDGVVRSAPVLRTAITDGRAVITGGFTNEEAKDLSEILKAGSLPAPLKIESKRQVGAAVGAESIKSGVKALAVGTIFVAVFMVIYYGTAGFISVLALILNTLIVLAIMALMRATLTLSGIGGILLTIGMAVDANVLIYERMREELAAGRPLRQAINLGFDRAFGVIFDSNLTTLLSALVLLQFTEGSVKGFALTMTFGLLANLFTGLTVTHTLCALWFQKFGHLSLGKLKLLTKTAVPFIKLRWMSWSISAGSLLIVMLIALGTGSVNLSVDFAGGYRGEVKFAQPTSESDIRAALNEVGIEDPNIQGVVDFENYYIIDSRLLNNPAPDGPAKLDNVQYTETQLRKALDTRFPNGYTIEMGSSFGAQTAQEFGSLALIVVILSSLSIGIYLWFRFELVFGIAAVVALIHDLLLVFFLSSLWGVQVSLDVVAAFMVLMGFSVNDTIVVFDRIREDAQTGVSKSFAEVCDLAMNQTVSRTLITSGTVMFAALALFLIGGEGLRPFAKVYLLGTIFGTYSSFFIATPLVYQYNKWKGNRLLQQLSQKKKKVEAAKPIRGGVTGGTAGGAAPTR